MPALDDDELRAALAARDRARTDYLAAADRLAHAVIRELERGATLQAVADVLGVRRQAVAQAVARSKRRHAPRREPAPGPGTGARATKREVPR